MSGAGDVFNGVGDTTGVVLNVVHDDELGVSAGCSSEPRQELGGILIRPVVSSVASEEDRGVLDRLLLEEVVS